MPARCISSTKNLKSSGGPKRDVGAKNPVTWYPQDPENGCSRMGMSSMCVKPISFTYAVRSVASSR